MSFLYEKDNLDKIIDSLSKTAQTAPVDADLVKRMSDRLSAELSPAAGDKFTPNTAAQGDSGLTLADLKLDKLLSFLAANKINFGEDRKYRIAFTQADFKNATDADLPADVKENYDLFGGYYVNPAALAQYVKYLQNKLQGQNPLINARLRLLVDEVNQQFPGANLSRRPGQADLAIKDTEELDKIDNSFSPKYGVKDGPNSLTVGDLKSKENFNSWLQTHEAQVVTYDAKGMAHEELYAKAKDLKAAWNTILKALYDRASRLRELATTQELAKKYDYYKGLLSNLGAGSGSTSPSGGSTQPVSYNPGNSAGGMSPVNFDNIIDSLPLANDINLFRIQSFFETIKNNYTDPQTLPIINSYMAAAQTAIDNLKNITNDLNIVQENTTAKDFAYMLKGSTANYGPAVNLLYAIINNTRQVIATINSSFGRVLSDEQKSKLSNQIDFYYGKNRGLLNDLLREANQIAR